MSRVALTRRERNEAAALLRQRAGILAAQARGFADAAGFAGNSPAYLEFAAKHGPRRAAQAERLERVAHYLASGVTLPPREML